jgi:hypothetical protein
MKYFLADASPSAARVGLFVGLLGNAIEENAAISAYY